MLLGELQSGTRRNQDVVQFIINSIRGHLGVLKVYHIYPFLVCFHYLIIFLGYESHFPISSHLNI